MTLVPRARVLLLSHDTALAADVGEALAHQPEAALDSHCLTAAQALEILAVAPIDLVLIDADTDAHEAAELLSALTSRPFRCRTLGLAGALGSAASSRLLRLGAEAVALKGPPHLFTETIRGFLRSDARGHTPGSGHDPD